MKGVAPTPANGLLPIRPMVSTRQFGSCNWPAPASDEQTAVDDLGRRCQRAWNFFGAMDLVSLGNSISATLSGGPLLVQAAGSVSNPVLTPRRQLRFIAGYDGRLGRGLVPSDASIRSADCPDDGRLVGSRQSLMRNRINPQHLDFRCCCCYDKLKAFTAAEPCH